MVFSSGVDFNMNTKYQSILFLLTSTVIIGVLTQVPLSFSRSLYLQFSHSVFAQKE